MCNRFCVSPWLAAVPLTMLTLAPFVLAGGVDGNRNELLVAADGYLSNREKFTRFLCKYSVLEGKAKSIDDALAGIFIDPIVTHAVWARDGDKAKYEINGDQRLIAAALSKAGKDKDIRRGGDVRVGVPFVAYEYLSDGKVQLRHNITIQGVNVHSGDGEVIEAMVSPFGAGIMAANDYLNPGKNLRDAATGQVTGTYEGTLTRNGKAAMVFTRGGVPGEAWFKYFLDPHRSFQPVEIWGRGDTAKNLTYKCFFTSYRECSGGRWFPERSVTIWHPDREKPPFFVREVKVTHLNADEPPPASEFSITIPAGTQVSAPGGSSKVFYPKEPQQITNADLPGLWERLHSPVTPSSSTNRGLFYAYLVGANVLALTVLTITIYYFRRIRKARPTDQA